jgi:hypothetical protein
VRDAGDARAREVAAAELDEAAARLRHLVSACPQLLRVRFDGATAILSPSGPVTQPGDTGALLLETIAPGEGLAFSTSTGDLSQPRGESSQVAINIAGAGTNYAVVGLERLPFGRTTVPLQFNRAGAGPVRVPLTSPHLNLDASALRCCPTIPASQHRPWCV